MNPTNLLFNTEITTEELRRVFWEYADIVKWERIQRIQEDLSLLKDFQRRFPRNILETLTLEQYCLGWENKDSFSNWLERKTEQLGSIRGGFSSKFWVYYSKTERRYKYTRFRFSDEHDAIIKIREALTGIFYTFNRSILNDSKVINTLSTMVRYKVYYLYHPDDLLPIFNIDQIQEFLDLLWIKDEGAQSTYQLSEELYEWVCNKLGVLLKNLVREVIDMGNIRNMWLWIGIEENIISRQLVVGLLYWYKNWGNNRMLSWKMEDDTNVNNNDVWTKENTDVLLDVVLERFEKTFQDNYSQYITTIEENKKSFDEKIKIESNDLRREIKDMEKNAMQFIGIFASIVTLLSVDVAFLKSFDTSNPFALIWAMLLVNVLPLAFYGIVIMIFGSEKREKLKINYLVITLILQVLLGIVFIFIGHPTYFEDKKESVSSMEIFSGSINIPDLSSLNKTNTVLKTTK